NVKVNTLAPVAGTRLTATVMPPEAVERLKPDYVAPAVIYMASNECQDSGLIIEAGAGNFNRAAIVRGKGIQPGIGDIKDAEWVAENWAAVTSLADAEPMWRTGQTLKDYKASLG
ncbi:MAG TPA: short-chain dehydrogenase, partial [Dehalococcoidia bacterium]|nr:short-chain dehydrogenase [Dehalococcoidia bacterium]